MKETVFKQMTEKYKDIKKISEGDFSEIDELEKNPIVQRYNYLLGLKNSRYEFENEDRIAGYLLRKYGYGFIQETNDIWCLVYEISVQQYEEWFKTSLSEYDKNSTVLVYYDIENNQKHIAISKDEQENFESTHNVIFGKLSIKDDEDRYYNVRHEFFSTCLNEGQEVAIQRILKKYSKDKD